MAPKHEPDEMTQIVTQDDARHKWQMSGAMESALTRLQVDPRTLAKPLPPFFWRVTWEELCTIRTRDDKMMVSPVLAVITVAQHPEDTNTFDDYVGMVYTQCVTERGDNVAFTHSLYYRETGEKLALSEYLTAQPPPFLLRIAYIETSKQGRHVVRPVPVDIEVLG